MSETWGLPETPAARRADNGRDAPSRGRLSPKVTAAAHRGIVWLHLVAMGIWLLVAGVLGTLAATGRDVPTIILIVALGATAGHGLFLAIHRLLAATSRSRAGQDGASLAEPAPAQPAPPAAPAAGEPLTVGAPGRRPDVPVRQK